MKLTKYISATILLLALLTVACEDATYTDQRTSPAKASGIEMCRFMTLLSDGSVAAVNNDFHYTIIDRDGSCKAIGSYLELLATNVNIRLNSSDEMFYYAESGSMFALMKHDKDGKYVYTYYGNDIKPMASTPLDNGEYAFFCKEYYDEADKECTVMRIIDQKGKLKDYMILMEEIDNCIYAASFNDRIIVFDGYDNYYIYLKNGTFVNSGNTAKKYQDPKSRASTQFATIKYINGYIYTVFQTNITIPEKNIYGFYWLVTKMDVDGHEIFTQVIDLKDMSNNITVHDGTLFLTGSYLTEDNAEYGELILLDDNDGTIKDSIKLDYSSKSIPWAVAPAGDGGYDVYVIRRNAADDNNSKLSLYADIFGYVFIYHTHDFHDLQIN